MTRVRFRYHQKFGIRRKGRKSCSFCNSKTDFSSHEVTDVHGHDTRCLNNAQNMH